MTDIKINYTLFLVNDWERIFRYDLQTLKKSGLIEECVQFNIFAYPFNKIAYSILESELQDFRDKINLLWQDSNRYEFPAIDDLRKDPMTYNLYFHSKGVTNPYGTRWSFKCSMNWHMYMSYYNIIMWKTCVDQINSGYDAVGVEWFERDKCCFFAGNFWWASKDHMQRLSLERIDTSDRMNAEKFVTSIKGRYMSNCKAPVENLYLQMFDYVGLTNPIQKEIR